VVVSVEVSTARTVKITVLLDTTPRSP